MDRAILLWVNHLGGPRLDPVMRFASNGLVLFAVLCCAVIFVLSSATNARPKALVLVAAVSMTELLTARIVKPLAARQRPCWTEQVRTVIGCGSNESMASNHAATTAAGAVALVWAAPITAVVAIPAVLLVGVSRVYLAVHYPSDIVVGWLLGIAFGLLTIAGGYVARPGTP